MKNFEITPLLDGHLEKAIEDRITALEKAMQLKQAIVNSVKTNDKLYIKKCGSHMEYYRRSGETSELQYLRRGETDLIRRIAQAEYDRKVLTAMKKEMAFLHQVQQKYQPNIIGDIYEAYSEERKKLITPCVFHNAPDEFIRHWEQFEYEHKPIPPECKEFVTLKGHCVRSKSEIMIADALTRNHIPYRYEEPLFLSGFGIIHPDFTILDIQAWKVFCWEHFGMMDNPEYSIKAIRKINALNAHGFFEGINLITTFETKENPLTPKKIEMVIQHYLSTSG